MKWTRIALVSAAVLALPALASAQDPRTDIGSNKGQQTFNVRGHFIFWGALGFDLDLIGDITGPTGVVVLNGTQALVDGTTYPDVFVRTQRRRHAGVGFGLFKKAEVFARYQQANNPAATVGIGHAGSQENIFNVRFDNYRDTVIEGGLRKYMATPKSTRQYIAISYGKRTVEQLSVTLQAPGGNIPVRLYDKGKATTIGIDFGVTVEYKGHVGAFLEAGLRYTGKLLRNDDDLRPYGLELMNNTGPRIFMPATIGVLLRF